MKSIEKIKQELKEVKQEVKVLIKEIIDLRAKAKNPLQ